MTALEAPRRVLLGRARYRAMQARIALAWWPIVAALAMAILLLVAPWQIPAGLALMIVAVEAHRPGWHHRRLIAAWWRTRWWFDARACGLVAIADPSVNAVHERGGSHAVGIEVAPTLTRLTVTRHGRRYRIRLLPGQLLDDLDRAVPALAERWSGQVTVHPQRRARTVELEVVTSDAVAQTVTYPRRRR